MLSLSLLAVVLGAGVTLWLTLLDLRWGVVLLTVVALINVFLEQLFLIELDILVGLAVLTGFFARFALHRVRWRRSTLDVPVLILALAGLFTLTAMAFRGSDYFGETGAQVISLTMVMGMSLVVFQLLRDFRSIQLTLKAYTLTTAAIAFFGVLALFLGIRTVHIGSTEVVVASKWGGVGLRTGGVFGQPNIFATPLVLALPIEMAFALIGRSKWQRILWASAAGMCAVALLLSQSRSGILGAFLGILVMSVILKKGIKPSKLIGYALVTGFLVYGVLTMTGMLDPVLERLSVSYQIYQLKAGAPEQNRLLIWQKALPLALRNPFGYGAETKYLVGESFGIEQKSVHNVFLGYLTGLGWLGFAGVFLLALSPIRGLWRFVHTRGDIEWKTIGAGLLAGLIGLWVHNFFHSMIHWVAVWLYLALVAATVQLSYIPKKGLS